ncbi:MAG: 3-dehydroquinate synthase [Oscillospiraceae bacterium]|jgi:3-dehydroquinate synthase|nr:3-dehydroquinate synthase [Oscillospiraceae bacterium]
MTEIQVQTNQRSYSVFAERGLLSHLPVTAAPGEKALIVTDSNVAPLYCDTVEQSLKKAGFSVHRFVFKSGEQAKNLTVFGEILEVLAMLRFSRTDKIFALGGGVVGDLAGFAASAFMRGIEFYQIPTTLLAMVDSSVGGKTGVNLAHGKNLTGAFWQPTAVFLDADTLTTLPELQIKNGTAEMLKTGVIRDAELFARLADSDTPELADILRCIEIKAEIVSQDERESGVRKLLNFGHTVGHAVEKLSDYAVPHGFAVAAGMAVAVASAQKRGLASGCLDPLLAALRRHGLPRGTEYGAAELAQAVLSDKKLAGGKIDLILPTRIGSAEVVPLDVGEIEGFIADGLEVLRR